MIPRQPSSTLFPYTTLFRSWSGRPARRRGRRRRGGGRGRARTRGSPGRRATAASGGRCAVRRSEEHTSELQSQSKLVCRLLLEKKNYQVFLLFLPCRGPRL